MKENLKTFIEFLKTVSFSDLNYQLETYEMYKKVLFDRAKFKVGDKIALKETTVITEEKRPGWLHYKNLLVKDAIGVVQEVDYFDERINSFVYYVVFDRDENKDKSIFLFKEKELKKGDK